MTALSHQAGCVVIGGRALLIEGPPGSGKSSLALALIDRGAGFIGDDGVLIEPRTGALIVRPHHNTRGLIEVRNLGLIERPVLPETTAALVLRFDPTAPRFIDAAETVELAGIALPLIRLFPGGANLAIKAELALEKFGLSRG